MWQRQFVYFVLGIHDLNDARHPYKRSLNLKPFYSKPVYTVLIYCKSSLLHKESEGKLIAPQGTRQESLPQVKLGKTLNLRLFSVCFWPKIMVDPEIWWKKSLLKSSEEKKVPRTTWHDQDQEYNFLILGPFQCSLCKYPELHLFIKWQQKTTARETLYRTISLHIIGGGKNDLKRDMEKQGSFDHFPKGTGCTPWFFRISADTKLNWTFNNSGLNGKKLK